MRYFVQLFGRMSRVQTPNNYNGQASVSFTHDRYGNRKYVNTKERRKFLKAAKRHPSQHVFTFCAVMVFSGARISEVLALTPRLVDIDDGVVVIRTLKKRRDTNDAPVYRAIPLPPALIDHLDAVHAISAAQGDPELIDTRIWPWCRTTAWRRIKDVMHEAGITGVRAVPKGLRHGYAVGALCEGVNDLSVMKLLGHARLETTRIYSDAVGDEARAITKKIWQPLLQGDLLG